MGAWGDGLQANDTAWDAIGAYEPKLRGILRTKTVLKRSISLHKILTEIKEQFGTDDWQWGVLGVVEWLLDHGLRPRIFKSSRYIIDEAIALERGPDQLDCWKEPENRKRVLELLEKRLNGEKVSQAELDEANEGLISRMTRKLAGISYKEAYGSAK